MENFDSNWSHFVDNIVVHIFVEDRKAPGCDPDELQAVLSRKILYI